MGILANAALAIGTQLHKHVCTSEDKMMRYPPALSTSKGGVGAHFFKGAERVGLHRAGLTDMEM